MSLWVEGQCVRNRLMEDTQEAWWFLSGDRCPPGRATGVGSGGGKAGTRVHPPSAATPRGTVANSQCAGSRHDMYADPGYTSPDTEQNSGLMASSLGALSDARQRRRPDRWVYRDRPGVWAVQPFCKTMRALGVASWPDLGGWTVTSTSPAADLAGDRGEMQPTVCRRTSS